MGVRMKDVADRAGVSPRTVSNVVSGSAAVAQATRQRVEAAIAELGYRPNLAARSLRAGHTGMIGLAIPELTSPYFAEIAALLVEGARRRGWTVVIEQTHGDPEAERRLLRGGERVVDGLIISPWALAPSELAASSSSARPVPLVLLGERSPDDRMDRVAIDNVAAADDAVTHLLARGARRVAVIGLQPHLENRTAQLRTEGYRRALHRAGLTPQESAQIPVTELHRRDGAQAMSELLDRSPAPDAVFAFSDELALGAMSTARERGLRIPEDLLVMGIDDIEDGAFSGPGLTTIAPDKQQIADRALQCLADRIYSPGNSVPPQDLVIPHALVRRGSA
ncbi:LacI family DNA-binding transcriptional regulator [Brachybacterium sp. YJGR34]|uniref:LacI family DNA-binding transcriptional regulator n=1 Tax=Brachybacterium sp. YJGR34 TaxID=2059911 RepID=UPI000E0CBAD0|nr:LacI family DNA-binding transcriptional regulator [Brachybacterium sp. YJGR34]